MESGSGDVTRFINQAPYFNTTQSSAFSFSFFLSVPSAIQLLLCGIVLLIFYRLPRLRTVSSLPVVNLIASHFVRAVLSLLAIPAFRPSSDEPSSASNIFCVAVQFINNTQFAWSSWAIAIVAYSRYDTVVNVLTPKFNKRRFWISTTISWLISLLTSLPPLTGWSLYGVRRRRNTYSCSTGSQGGGVLQAIYLPFFYLINFLVPTVLVVFLFARIFRQVRSHLKFRRSLDSSTGSSNIAVLESADNCEQQHRKTVATQVIEMVRSKAFRYIVAIVMTNLLLVTPFACVKSYGAVCSEMKIFGCVPSAAYQATALLFTLNFNVNAILYVFWVRTMRQFTMSLCCSCRHPTTNRTS